MKITLADKFIAWLTLLSGLSISAVAVWYSVAGLVSIFAASPIPIIVMGVTLEVSKLIATVWLKLNWERAPTFIKGYLLAAIAVLMVVTSMGIFGYLSKAHSDQTLVSGEVQSKLAIYDQKIQTAKENIEADRKQLKQMDEAVDQVMARSKDERGANNANNIRRSQQKDRTALAKNIEANQKLIVALNDEAAPIRAEIRKVEAEVGPIKYIAAFIYGDNPDANILEKAVTWVIIIIVSVFDPLAVILLLSSQYSFMWFRKQEEEDYLLHDTVPHDSWVADVGEKPTAEELKEEVVEEVRQEPFIAEHHPDTHPYLRQGFKYPEGWEPHPPMVYKPEEPVAETVVEPVVEETPTPEEILDDGLKSAKQNWKADNPADTIKHQERLYELGLIDQLPWEKVEEFDQQIAQEPNKLKLSDVVRRNPMSTNFEVSIDNVTQEQLDASKKNYMVKEDNHQVKKTKE